MKDFEPTGAGPHGACEDCGEYICNCRVVAPARRSYNGNDVILAVEWAEVEDDGWWYASSRVHGR